MTYCGARTVEFYDPTTDSQVNPSFLSYDATNKVLKVQSTNKADVAIHNFRIKVTLTSYPTPIHQPYPDITVTILCDCPDTTLDPFVLVQPDLTVSMYTNTTSFVINIPKDSSSKVQSI